MERHRLLNIKRLKCLNFRLEHIVYKHFYLLLLFYLLSCIKLDCLYRCRVLLNSVLCSVLVACTDRNVFEDNIFEVRSQGQAIAQC